MKGGESLLGVARYNTDDGATRHFFGQHGEASNVLDSRVFYEIWDLHAFGEVRLPGRVSERAPPQNRHRQQTGALSNSREREKF